MEFKRKTPFVHFPYEHWAIYIGPFKIRREDGTLIEFEHAVSHLAGKNHKCTEEYPCVVSELRAPSIGVSISLLFLG